MALQNCNPLTAGKLRRDPMLRRTKKRIARGFRDHCMGSTAADEAVS